MNTLAKVAYVTTCTAMIAVGVYYEVKIKKIRESRIKAKPKMRKLDRQEHHAAVMSVVKQCSDKNYVEAMDVLGQAVDCSKITPLYTEVN